MKYPLGFLFTLKRGKQDIRECVVTDFLTTTNVKGEIVKTEYVISYKFLGQLMKENMVQTTIDRAVWVEAA